MSEYRFDAKTIEYSLKTQAIEIKFSLDLDEDSLNTDNVILAVLNNGAQRMVPFELFVDGDVLTLKLSEWAVPNQKYTLLIQPGIMSITEEQLDHAVMRNFVFESEVTSKIDILTPGDFEVVEEASFSWNEIGDTPVGNYYIEVAEDNAFYNIVLKASTAGKAYKTDKVNKPGQYFFRVRAQINEEKYGAWSDIRTFRLSESSVKKPSEDTEEPTEQDVPTTPSDELDPVVIDTDVQEELAIVNRPENGITPPYFAFVFNSDIDASEAVIDVIRSDF